jgi:hypothetical protein
LSGFLYVYHVCAWCHKRIPWNWSYRCLWVTPGVLGTKSSSSARAASALRCWAISPSSMSIHLLFVCFVLFCFVLFCFVLHYIPWTAETMLGVTSTLRTFYHQALRELINTSIQDGEEPSLALHLGISVWLGPPLFSGVTLRASCVQQEPDWAAPDSGALPCFYSSIRGWMQNVPCPGPQQRATQNEEVKRCILFHLTRIWGCNIEWLARSERGHISAPGVQPQHSTHRKLNSKGIRVKHLPWQRQIRHKAGILITSRSQCQGATYFVQHRGTTEHALFRQENDAQRQDALGDKRPCPKISGQEGKTKD